MSIGLESYFFLVNEFIVDEITQEYWEGYCEHLYGNSKFLESPTNIFSSGPYTISVKGGVIS